MKPCAVCVAKAAYKIVLVTLIFIETSQEGVPTTVSLCVSKERKQRTMCRVYLPQNLR